MPYNDLTQTSDIEKVDVPQGLCINSAYSLFVSVTCILPITRKPQANFYKVRLRFYHLKFSNSVQARRRRNEHRPGCGKTLHRSSPTDQGD